MAVPKANMKDERDQKQLQDDELDRVTGGQDHYYPREESRRADGRVYCNYYNVRRFVIMGPYFCESCERSNTPRCIDGWAIP